MKAAWPAVLERVLQARRFSWILLSQNAEPVEARDDMLTLGFSNPGARDSYMSGGSQQLLSQALATVTGQRWRINAIVVGPDAASRQQRPSEPTAPTGANGADGDGLQPAQGSQASSSPPPMTASTIAVGGTPVWADGAAGRLPKPDEHPDRASEVTSGRPGPAGAHSAEAADDDPGVSADDETIDDNTDTASLLSSALGAELIAEEADDV